MFQIELPRHCVRPVTRFQGQMSTVVGFCVNYSLDAKEVGDSVVDLADAQYVFDDHGVTLVWSAKNDPS